MVTMTMVVVVLLFSIGPASAELDRQCLDSCLSGCDVPPQWMQQCIKQCYNQCTHDAAATDSQSGKVHGQ
ncbi:hypothetical protein F3Y22_tig00117026pilonHSYRG00052 [Hibiscus syriacus]|uniref:Uncharacterized protein n=1 Tax=Hibiscus syriacus TaxID=106335 RepID=A0A6A2WCJ2_HIBSY|nr:hypothetical protein F3Y22_tig00117026pilonHSYRG00052 [Hibiscus syriacus]